MFSSTFASCCGRALTRTQIPAACLKPQALCCEPQKVRCPADHAENVCVTRLPAAAPTAWLAACARCRAGQTCQTWVSCRCSAAAWWRCRNLSSWAAFAQASSTLILTCSKWRTGRLWRCGYGFCQMVQARLPCSASCVQATTLTCWASSPQNHATLQSQVRTLCFWQLRASCRGEAASFASFR